MVKNSVLWIYSIVCIGSVLSHDLDWWQSSIIYQIYPLSFKDSNGDSYGDLNGITEKLEYLKGLGIGAISLPLMKSPFLDMDSEVSDFLDVDDKLGTMDDFDRLMNKSNELGIKVILEFIPNHSSDQHPWFQKSVKQDEPYIDFYVWANGRNEKTKRAVPVTTTELELLQEVENNVSDVDNSTNSKNSSIPINTTANTTSSNTTIPGKANAKLPGVHEANSTVITNGTMMNQSNLNNTSITSKSSIDSMENNGTNSSKESNNTSKKDKMLPPNNWISKTGGSAWQWNEERQQFYLHQSTAKRPDLNYRNPKVMQEMKDILTFWLDKGVHGFRLVDVPLLYESENLDDEPESSDPQAYELPYNITGYWNLTHTKTMDQPETYDMVVQWRQLLDDYKMNSTDETTRVLIIDGMITTNDSMFYYGNTSHPGAHLVITCNFICTPQDWQASYVDLLIRWWEDSTPIDHPIAWMTGNQNVARVGSHFSPELIDVMNILLLLLPGVPFTYYGEEIGMMNNDISFEQTYDIKDFVIPREHYRFFSNDPARTPFQWDHTKSAGFSTNATTWLPIHGNHINVNFETERQINHSHYRVYESLAKLRQLRAVQHGSYNPHVFSQHVFGFSRKLEDHNSIAVVFNLGNNQQKIDLLQLQGTLKTMCLFISTNNVDFEDPDNVQLNNLVLPSMSSLVLTEKCIKNWDTDVAVLSNVPSLVLLLVCSIGALRYGIL